VKRGLLVLALAAVVGGVVFAYLSIARAQAFSRLIAAGNAALEADQTFQAIEAFSMAIENKNDSMLAYLRRGRPTSARGSWCWPSATCGRPPASTRPRRARSKPWATCISR